MNPQIEDAITASRPAPGLMVRDQLGKTLFALAALGLPWVLIGAWSTHDLGFTVTAAGLVGGLLYVLAFVALFGLPNMLRANGYRRLAPWVLVGVVLEMIGTITALPLLSHTDLVRLPVLGAAAVAVLLALAGICLEATDLDLPVTNENTWWERSSVIFDPVDKVAGHGLAVDILRG